MGLPKQNSGMLVPEHADICVAADSIRSHVQARPRVGVILGSGLGSLAERIVQPTIIPYANIPHFPVSGAPNHKGLLHLGELFGQPAVLMQGRIHLYEGYSPKQVAFPVRVMKELGVEALIVTNAAGGINKLFQVGDLMAIEDHINLAGLSGLDPTRGAYEPELGPRFTSLNKAYDPEYIRMIEAVAETERLTVHRGVYAFTAGPCFETSAEVRFLSTAGADAVGMSTIPEIMAARHAGIRVLAISAITNLAIHETDSVEETTEEEVWESVDGILPKLETLIAGFLSALSDSDSDGRQS